MDITLHIPEMYDFNNIILIIKGKVNIFILC